MLSARDNQVAFVSCGVPSARPPARTPLPCTQVERLAAIRKLQRSSSSRRDKDKESKDPPPCEVFPPAVTGGDGQRNRAVEGLRRPFAVEARRRALGASPRPSWVLDTPDPDPSDPDRAWLYQTCTEFGFYQARLFVAYRPVLRGYATPAFLSVPTLPPACPLVDSSLRCPTGQEKCMLFFRRGVFYASSAPATDRRGSRIDFPVRANKEEVVRRIDLVLPIDRPIRPATQSIQGQTERLRCCNQGLPGGINHGSNPPLDRCLDLRRPRFAFCPRRAPADL